MIEADARRSEWLAGKFGRWATERGAAVNAIMEAVIVDHRREPKPRQQLAIDIARALKKVQKNDIRQRYFRHLPLSTAASDRRESRLKSGLAQALPAKLSQALLLHAHRRPCALPNARSMPASLPGSNSRAVLGLAPSSLGQTISAGLKPLAERRNSLPEDGRQGVFDPVLTMAAEVQGAKTGIWNNPAVIKNTESPDDILARIGRLTVVEARFCSWGKPGKPDSGLLEFRAELYMGTLL